MDTHPWTVIIAYHKDTRLWQTVTLMESSTLPKKSVGSVGNLGLRLSHLPNKTEQ